jgi:predicted TIM-barrel fold metal-dependent hydrolase
MQEPLTLHDLDRRIWQEELAPFVPPRVFDIHTHVYRWAFNLDPKKETGPYASTAGVFPEATWDLLGRCDALLLPGREVHRLAFGFPFAPQCAFDAANRFTAAQVAGDPASAGLMLTHPSMTAEQLEAGLAEHGFLGFKPYRFFATTGDAVQCRIGDFLPEHQVAVADRHRLIVMLHLARRDGGADAENLADLERLTDAYPRVRWVLAHCARSYLPEVMARAVPRLRRLTSVWCDTSSVCEPEVVRILLEALGPDRVMYGSDDVPVGVLRGKYITFGRAWAFLSEKNHTLNLTHCDPRMTFVRYEQLRAMRVAARALGLGARDIEKLFCHTAERLVADVRRLRL